jgi:hypothetical protein
LDRRIENPRVGGSIPPQATTVFTVKPRPVRWSGLFYNSLQNFCRYVFALRLEHVGCHLAGQQSQVHRIMQGRGCLRMHGAKFGAGDLAILTGLSEARDPLATVGCVGIAVGISSSDCKLPGMKQSM